MLLPSPPDGPCDVLFVPPPAGAVLGGSFFFPGGPVYTGAPFLCNILLWLDLQPSISHSILRKHASLTCQVERQRKQAP